MKIRKLISLTALVSSILLLLTSIVLYIVPQGRIAYWADWRLWGLSKTEWSYLHINLGFLFVAAIVWHVCLNWKPVLAYLKNHAKQLTVFTREFNGALAVTVVVIVGTYFMIPPFSSILYLSESIKDNAAVFYGEPPYGHAELSTLASLVSKTQLDLDTSMAALKKAGLKINGPNQVFLDIAKANQMSPGQVFSIIKIQSKPVASDTLPADPPAGIGRKPLAELCIEHGLDLNAVVRAFGQQGIQADARSTFKALAETHRMNPEDLYRIIQNHIQG